MAGEPAGPQRVTIHAIAHGGEGIGRVLEQTDARVWFIEGALPGDTVLAEATQVKTRMIRGRTLELLDASPLRQDPPCALSGRCGGCGWQHVRADAQADLKAQIVTDLLRKFKVPVARVFASPAASISLRTRFFGLKNPRSRLGLQALNKQLWVLQRVVLHPTYRGAGVASNFVGRACDLCLVPWIETLSAMARVNPFFERAGFQKLLYQRAS